MEDQLLSLWILIAKILIREAQLTFRLCRSLRTKGNFKVLLWGLDLEPPAEVLQGLAPH